ncbi:MAG: TonB-dependent receptor, partial [Acidobacteria bacterium]|nr:TonB-dependent receptor [Acidobacteriota bacterium]
MLHIKRIVASILALGCYVWGQTVSSTVKGVLVDQTRAAVPWGDCTLTEQSTKAVLSTVAWTDGSFSFLNVPRGTYNLDVRANGFKTFTMKEIVVTANEVRTLGEIKLEIGSLQDRINVTAEAGSLQLATAERAGLVTGKQLNDIAVKGRDFFGLLVTIPGVVDNYSQGHEALSGDSTRGTSINGSREDQKNVTLDGISLIQDGSNQTLMFQPNMDSIAEIKILTSNYQAEFGRSSGGTLSLISKGGTQDFHGSAYEFYRHESLNANSFYNNRTGTPKAPYRYRITGYSLGGPVYWPRKFNTDRSKLFFFWSQELVGNLQAYGTRLVTMPTAAERNGDFSQTFDINGRQIPITDPLTQSPFPGNIIPSNRINKLGKSILNFYPLPNYTDPDPRNRYAFNYRSTFSGGFPRSQETLRMDWNIRPTIQASYRYLQYNQEQNPPYGVWVNGAINFFLTPVRYALPGRGHSLHLTTTISPTLVNEVTFGRNANEPIADFVDPQAVNRSRMGNPPQWFKGDEPQVNYMPDVGFGAPPSNAVNSGLGRIPDPARCSVTTIMDNGSKVWRTHTVKAGFYVEDSRCAEESVLNYRGAFNFGMNVNNPFDTRHGFSNAALGSFFSYTEATGRPTMDFRFRSVEWFVQDNWKVTRRLTLDVGIRFYHQPPARDARKNLATFDPALYNRSAAPSLYIPALDSAGLRVGKDPRSGTLVPAAYIGFFVPGSGDFANGSAVGGKNGYPDGPFTFPAVRYGPRFGFAYDLLGTGKTVLRGGFGRLIDRQTSLYNYWTGGNPPVAYTPTLYYGNLDTYAQSAGAIAPTNVRAEFGAYKQSSTMNFSLGIQREVWKTVLDVSYVGALLRHLGGTREINPIPMFARFNPANADPTVPGRPLPDNFLRPYPGWGGILVQSNAYNA